MASKAKKGQQKPKPPPLRGNHTVRECMTWHYTKGYVPDNTVPPERYLASKGGVGKGKDYGYVIDASHPPVVHTRADDGTVIEALRGWPHHRNNDVENGNYGNEFPPIDVADQGQGCDNANKDPWMSDLISHRFLNDAVRRRQMEEQEEADKAAAAKNKRATGAKADIKGNRTSQLRSIALAEKVHVDPKDLWQMPKFKNNAKPHLSTQQKKQKARAGSGKRAARGGTPLGGGGDPCTCYNDTNDVNLDDAYQPYTGYDNGPVNGELDPAFQDENRDENLFTV